MAYLDTVFVYASAISSYVISHKIPPDRKGNISRHDVLLALFNISSENGNTVNGASGSISFDENGNSNVKYVKISFNDAFDIFLV